MKVRELLADPEKWTQGHYARASSGLSVGAFSEAAKCWCMEGAIRKCYPNHGERDVARRKIKSIVGIGMTIQHFNDKSSHAEVMNVLEEADI